MAEESDGVDARWNEPNVRALWLAVGVTSCEEAENWVRVGFDLHGARSWKREGFDDPFEARDWRGAVFAPPLATLWEGFYSFEPEEAEEWFNVGVYDPVDADIWRGNSFEPHTASSWLLVGCDAQQAFGWNALRVRPLSVLEWQRFGIDDPQVAGDWLGRLGDQQEAFRWLRAGFDAPTASDWAGLNIEPTVARGWLDLGVDSAKDAAKFMRDGFTPDNPPPLGRKAAISAQRTKKRARGDAGS